MNQALFLEELHLRLAWDRHCQDYLDRYLVSSVQDPRINGQSILTRAWLADTLFPGRFDALIDEELRFGAVLTWIVQTLERGSTRCELLDAMESTCRTRVPDFVLAAYSWLQEETCSIPDYITGALAPCSGDLPRHWLSDPVLDVFMTIWNQQLSRMPISSLCVLEPACGSANDYRFLHRCGIARFLNYTGIDIAAKNIANARNRHPDANFLGRNILATELPDHSYDCLYCHDLLEHLSTDALERALAEMFRLARTDILLHFFNGKPGGDHEIVLLEPYHRNRLSMEKIASFFERLGATATVLEMDRWFREKIGSTGYHNPNAFSLIVEKGAGLAK